MQKDSWLYSDTFLKRAFAIWGHYFVANIIIAGIGFLVFFLFMLTVGLNLALMQPQKHMYQGDETQMEDDAQTSWKIEGGAKPLLD